MRFIQFLRKNDPKKYLGVADFNCERMWDLSTANLGCSNEMVKFIEQNFKISELNKKLGGLQEEMITEDIKLLPPVTNPKKIIAIGLNYVDHCIEQNKEKPKEPIFFSKFSNCLIGPGDNILYPPVTNSLDYEVELAVIIGKKAKDVPKLKAMDYIFGYTIAQDITARDWQKQKNGGQFLLGKSMDTFLPLGPSIAHKSIIEDPENLTISCKVNGIEKQHQKTSNMIFKIDEMISYLSQMITLEPGDVILTGTPGGVGAHRKPPEFLKVGDVVESEIEGIGKISNKVCEKTKSSE
ncbi:fumarylacetoacetate hydrolase domain-containing protein 2 [Condylostylus longicornis]|uniref:fumarylacetoacetate hydrolase domain-containing protein 2 n=1 Tax=Condylostylus longicornis TaxID=2530218 RepID=UPI00244DC459|nr:fumarylacetoacetate hydrolase domain-containing protein 2 [Condylostylus longicornis]